MRSFCILPATRLPQWSWRKSARARVRKCLKNTRYLRYRRKLSSFELSLSYRQQARYFFTRKNLPSFLPFNIYPPSPVLLGDTYLLTSRVMSLARLELIRRYLRWVDAPTDCAMFAWMLSAFTRTWCIIAITSRRKLYITTSIGSRNLHRKENVLELGNPLNFYLKFVHSIQVSLHSRLRLNVQNEAQMKLFLRSWVQLRVLSSSASTFASFKITVYLSRTNVISKQRSFSFRNTRVFDIII